MQNLSYLIQRSSDANNLPLTESSAWCVERRQKHPEPVKVLKKKKNPNSWEEEEEQICKSVSQCRKVPASHHSRSWVHCVKHWLTLALWRLLQIPGLGAVWRNRCAAWPQQKESSNQWLLKTTETAKAALVTAEGFCWCLFSVWSWGRQRKTGRFFWLAWWWHLAKDFSDTYRVSLDWFCAWFDCQRWKTAAIYVLMSFTFWGHL